MSRPSADTPPDIDALYRALLLERSPSDRVVMACGMFDTARAFVLASLPEGSDEAARRVHLFTRIYARDFDAETTRRIVDRLREASRGIPPSP